MKNRENGNEFTQAAKIQFIFLMIGIAIFLLITFFSN